MDYTRKVSAITNAINFQYPINITYDNQGKSRKVNPHCLYINGKGETCLDAWQVSGESLTKQLKKFKIFKVAKMDTIVSLQNEFFKEDSAFNHSSTRYELALVRIGG